MAYGNFQGYGVGGVPIYGYGGGTPANLAGAQPFSYSPTAGGIPQVPNPAATQQGAIQGNLASLGDLGALTQWANQLSLNYATSLADLNKQQAAWQQQQNEAQAARQNAANQALIRQQQEMYTPGLGGLEAQASQNAAAELAGQVSPGTVNTLAQLAAQRGAGGGFGPRSPATNAALMQALGLTAEGQQRQGQADFSAAVGRTPNLPITNAPYMNVPSLSAQPFNPASMFVTPAETQAAQYQANLLNAAPVPALAQQANLQNLLAGLRQGYGQTAPGQMFGGMAPSSPAIDIFQKYSGGGQQQPAQAAPTSGWADTTPDLTTAPAGTYVDPSTGNYSSDPWSGFVGAGDPWEGIDWYLGG